MNQKYDVIVIGSGPGGYVAAEYAAKNKLKTLCIEKDHLGGVCLNCGCIPTKTLLQSSKLYSELKHMSEFGIDNVNFYDVVLNWQAILARKNNVVKKLRMGINGLFKSAKVDFVKGEAQVLSDHEVCANDSVYQYDKLIVATGSYPKKFPLPGFSEGYESGKILTSDQALNLAHIPKSFTVVGGGVIGVEFAILFGQLGSKVTILQGVDRILELLDKDLSFEITKLLKSYGVEIITSASIEKYADGAIYYSHQNNKCKNEAEYYLVSVGRVPNTKLLTHLPNLELLPNGSVKTNGYLQTTIPNIYAIGDCSSKIMLAHSAYKNAIVAVDHILQRPNNHLDLLKVPACIYTNPEAASIGYTEEQLIEQNIPYYKVKFPYAHIGKILCMGCQFGGFFKLLVTKECGEILGCHIVGEHADDIISEISLAMESEATVETLFKTIHPHPTVSEIVWEAAKKLYVDYFEK